MLQENENKTKPRSENSSVNVQYSSQNNSKYFDADFSLYISESIIQFSKFITHGRGLSQKGVNFLFLSFFTGGLLYNYTVFPQSKTEVLQLYTVPLLLFLCVIIDLLKNVNYINTLFMKIFSRNNAAYKAILEDSINIYDLENYLEYKTFSPLQIRDIVEHLINKNQFSPKSQVKLMNNKALYEIESINYMKDLLLKFDFTSKSVCVFLRKMKMRLDLNYIEELTQKYNVSPSVLFSVGKYHKYKKNESNFLCKLGYEFQYKRKPYDELQIPIRVFGIILGIILLISISLQLIIQRTFRSKISEFYIF